MADKIPEERKYGDISTVTLCVGPEKTAFHVHEKLLFDCSAVFKAAFNSQMKEGLEKTMTLPDDEVRLFEIFIDWIYTRGLVLHHQTEDSCVGLLIWVYVLADRYDVPRLKTNICQAMMVLANRHEVSPSIPAISIAYDNLPSTSGLRRLLIDWYAYTMKPQWFDSEVVRGQLLEMPDFSADLIRTVAGLLKIGDKETPFSRDVSRYCDNT